MKINHQATLDRRHRMAAATLALAAGAMVAGGIGSAGPANAAADKYIALSYSLDGKVGGVGVAADPSSANALSLQRCVANGGNGCVTYGNAKNACAALAIGDNPVTQQEETFASATGLNAAGNLALKENGGGHIGVSGCTTFPTRNPNVPLPTPIRLAP